MGEAGTSGYDPVFIVGFPRSGTTLLATMLDRHSRMAVTPETDFFEELLLKDRVETDGASHDGLLARLAAAPRWNDLGLALDAIGERFRAAPATPPALLRATLETFAAGRGRARAGEKTPDHLRWVPVIFDWFPDARVIWILRDGRDAVTSLGRMPFARGDVVERSMRWVRSMELGEEHLARFEGRMIRIGFETLVREPIETLETIDAFCGLPFEPAQLDPEVPTGVVPESERDWKDRAKGAIDTSRIGQWKNEADERDAGLMNHVMGKRLAALGYEDRDAGSKPGFLAQGKLKLETGAFRKRLLRRARRRRERVAEWGFGAVGYEVETAVDIGPA